MQTDNDQPAGMDHAGRPFLPPPPLPPALASLLALVKEKMLPPRVEVGEVAPHAYAVDAEGGMTIMDMPDCSDQDMRAFCKAHLPRLRAVAVVAVMEAWSGAGASTPEEIALVERLCAEGRLQDAPPHLLRSVLRLFAEAVTGELVCEVATIREDGGARSLVEAAWEPRLLSRPRPTFRRYFPEALR